MALELSFTFMLDKDLLASGNAFIAVAAVQQFYRLGSELVSQSSWLKC